MAHSPTIYFTVTNDLSYDQRMERICTSLSHAGYKVILVGRGRQNAVPLVKKSYQQKRLHCFFQKGKLFYAEFNLRLFIYLLGKKMSGICAIDLDTILPCYYISKLKKVPRIYDAHELFCEMKEIVTRPSVYRVWKWIERKTVPHFKNGYTVNQPIAAEFRKMYGVDYEVIRNIAVYREQVAGQPKEKFILYQGAVNEGRSFETLIPAMKWVNAPLIICGDGNFMEQCRSLVQENGLTEKVIFKGMLLPDELRSYTRRSYIGITLFEKNALSNYYSLANRFFDYLHAGTPQICSNYPVYRELNNLQEIAVLVDDPSPEPLAKALNRLLEDESLWNRLHTNCMAAARILNWQEEEKKLLAFYQQLFSKPNDHI